MQLNKSTVIVFALSAALVDCGTSKSSSGGGGTQLTADNASVTLQQNSSASIDLKPGQALIPVLISAPAHGQVSIRGTLATYRATDPLYSGSDHFSYRVTKGAQSSNEATAAVTLTPLSSGTTTHTENYSGHAYALNGWHSYSSSFGLTGSTTVGFGTSAYNGAPADSRHFGIYGDTASYAGDAAYSALFGSPPVDGGAGPMKDFPWKAELVQIPECGVDATVTMKLVPNLGLAPMVALLLNYDIGTGSSGAQELNGYQLLINSGGGSLTLSRFQHVNELATAFMDRWPNTTYGNENSANPVTLGPYKGWNYRNGVWPAGGNVGVSSSMLVAVHYQYDVTTHTTTISYEARHPDGTDDTPGVWDEVVTLTGSDSLPTGGGFGLMPMNWHAAGQLNSTDFDVVEYRVQCTLP